MYVCVGTRDASMYAFFFYFLFGMFHYIGAVILHAII